MAKGPVVIRDIRYFEGQYSYLKDEAITAFGRRYALSLRAQGVSLGTWSHLYVGLTVSGVEVATIGAPDMNPLAGWFRWVELTMPESFPDRSAAQRCRLIAEATRDAICLVAPEQASTAREVFETVYAQADELRLLVQEKKNGRENVYVCVRLLQWPKPSFLEIYSVREDRISGARPIPLKFYTDAWTIVGKIRISPEDVLISPKDSFTARLDAERYGGFIRVSRADMNDCALPPMTLRIKGPV